jgi:hypothetical protein
VFNQINQNVQNAQQTRCTNNHNYIVSGHGGRLSSPEHYVWVPDGFEVVFFEPDDRVLLDTKAWPIYNHLLAGDEQSVGNQIVSRFTAGQQVYNYSCWFYRELRFNSGIIRVGAINPENPVVDLRQ